MQLSQLSQLSQHIKIQNWLLNSFLLVNHLISKEQLLELRGTSSNFKSCNIQLSAIFSPGFIQPGQFGPEI